ncbi:MAG: DUF1565 domain-containing protein [Clostridiaceae bacterium]|nr:DUF1565 domain-containing protein [Clostridiaceae bacterium]
MMEKRYDPTAVLPYGDSFDFWETEQSYDREFHVCAARGNDETGNGTEEAPFRTINRAAAIATAGTRVLIHTGEYRECVRAGCGGESPERMVSYEAAGDGEVVIKATEVATGFSRSTDFNLRFRSHDDNEEKEESVIWKHELDGDMFHGYNPFALINALHDKSWLHYSRTEKESNLAPFFLRRGAVYVDGKPLKQVELYSHMAREAGTYWVEEDGLKVHFRMPDNGSPEGHLIEVSCREQCFTTTKPFQNYIKVKGLTLTQAANGAPDPQMGSLSCNRGHHWIIEDNIVKYSNTVGMDVGSVSWAFKHIPDQKIGYHVIRRNQIYDSGVGGILGLGTSYTLVEDNLIARTGWQRMEYGWESGVLKFHNCVNSLFRRNIFREAYGCDGLWFDCSSANDRVTQNLFLNMLCPHGMILMECNRIGEVLIDNNILWNAKLYYDYNAPVKSNGTINIDSSEWNEPFAMHVPVGDAIYGLGTDDLHIVNNLICNTDGYGYAQDIVRGRMSGGRGGTSRDSLVVNNVFYDNRSGAIRLPNHDNSFEGNFYSKMPQGFLVLSYPAPSAQLDLKAWQKYENMDTNGGYAAFKVTIDDEALTMNLHTDKKRCTWDDRETVGYSSMKKVAPDAKVTTDYWGNVIEGDRMPGPFEISEDDISFSIDPRKV